MPAKSCPVCQSLEWNKAYVLSPWTILECRGCHYAKVDPTPDLSKRSVLYQEEKVIDRNQKKRSFLHQLARDLKYQFKKARLNKSEYFLKRVQTYTKNGGAILDIGCGDGAFLEMAKDNYECHGVEISDYLASLARKREKLHIHVGPFPGVQLGDQKYHALTMISLIEHITDPKAALSECYRLLSPGGVLILKTVNYQCWNRKIMGEKWTGLRPPDHVVYFDPNNLEKMLIAIGFNEVKSSSWFLNDNMYCEALK